MYTRRAKIIFKQKVKVTERKYLRLNWQFNVATFGSKKREREREKECVCLRERDKKGTEKLKKERKNNTKKDEREKEIEKVI